MVLFTIFFNLSENTAAASGPILPQLLLIAKQLVILALGGAAVGYVTGYLTRKLLGWMQLRRCQAAQELAVVFAMSYLAFYVGQALLEVSGVIAVVVYGLYGCAKGKWEVCVLFWVWGGVMRCFDDEWTGVWCTLIGIHFEYTYMSIHIDSH